MLDKFLEWSPISGIDKQAFKKQAHARDSDDMRVARPPSRACPPSLARRLYFAPILEISRSLRTHSSPGPSLTITYPGDPCTISHKRYLSIVFVRVCFFPRGLIARVLNRSVQPTRKYLVFYLVPLLYAQTKNM